MSVVFKTRKFAILGLTNIAINNKLTVGGAIAGGLIGNHMSPIKIHNNRLPDNPKSTLTGAAIGAGIGYGLQKYLGRDKYIVIAKQGKVNYTRTFKDIIDATNYSLKLKRLGVEVESLDKI